MSAITPTSSKFSSTSSSAASRKPSSLQETKSRVSFCQETQNDNNSNTINVKNSKDVNRVTCILPNIHSHNNNVAIAISGMTSELCQAKDGTEIIESQNNINEQNYTVNTEQLSLQSPSPSESLFPSPPHSLSQVSGLSYMEANRTASFKTWRFPFLGRNDKSLLVSPAEGAFAKTISRFSKHEEESCHEQQEQQQQQAEKEQKEEKEEQQKEFASSSSSQCPQISALANDTYHSFNMSRPANRTCKKSKSGSIKNNNNSNFTTTTTSSSNDNYTGSKNAKITNKRGSICNSASTITVYISAEKHHDSKVSSNVKVKHANEMLMKEKECECKKEECYSEEEQEQLQHQENYEIKDNKNYVKAEMQSEVSSALTTNKHNRSKRLSMRSELELATTQSKDEEHNHCYCDNNDADDDDEDEEEREYERLLNMVYASYVRNMKRLKHNSHEEHSQTAGTMTKERRESRAQKIPKNNNNTTKELASPHATSMLVFSRNKKVKPESEYQHYLQRESLMANSLTASTLLNWSASYYTHSTQWSHNHPNRQNSCTLPQNVHVLPCESNSFYTAIIQASSRGNVISPIPDYTSTYSSFSISSRHPSVSTSTSPFFQKRVIRSDILHKIEQRVLLQLTIFVKRLYTRLCHQNNFTNHVNSIGNNSNNSTTNNNNNNGNKNNKIELDQNHKTETAEQSSSRFVQITSNINIHDNIDNYSSSSAQKMINKAAATSITTTTSNVEAINANVMQEPSVRSISNHEKSIISKNNSNNNNNHIDIRTSEQHVSLQSPVSQAFSTAESNLSRSIRYRRMLTPVVRLVKHCHMLDGIEREVDNENLDLVVFVGMRLMGWLEVVSLLGAGSFGQVFLCKDLRICDGHFVHPSEMCGEDFMYWNCSHEYLPFGNSSSVPLHAPLVAVKVVKSVPLFEKQSVVEAEMLVLIGAQTPSATSMTEANNLENTNSDNYTSSSNSNNNELERRNKSENVFYTGVNNKPAPASLHTVYTNKNNIIDNDHESDNSAKVNYSKCATVKEQKTLLSSSSSSPSLAQEYLDAHSSSVINLYDTECNNYEHPPEADPRCAYVAKVLADGICYGHHCIVMERYGANLFEYIQHRNYHGLPLYQIQSIGKQLFSALSLLHNACHIVHADIKPENLLLTMDSCTGMRYANTNTKTTEANEQSSYIPLMHGCNNIFYNEIQEVENKCLIVAPSPLRVHVIEQSNYNDAEQDAEVAVSKNEVKNNDNNTNDNNSNSNSNINIARRSSNKIYKSIEQDNKQKPLIRIKLIDFSSSCYEDEACFSYIQSRYYRAPEVIVGARYGTPIDI